MRKAQLDFQIAMFFRIIGLTLTAFLAISIVILNYSDTKLKPEKVVAETFVVNVLNNDYINYHGLSGRVYQGVIPLENFTDESLSSLKLDRDLLAAKLTLLHLEGSEIGSVYYKKQLYQSWKPLVDAGLKGAPARTVKLFPVTIKNKGNYQPGFLRVEVLVP